MSSTNDKFIILKSLKPNTNTGNKICGERWLKIPLWHTVSRLYRYFMNFFLDFRKTSRPLVYFGTSLWMVSTRVANWAGLELDCHSMNIPVCSGSVLFRWWRRLELCRLFCCQCYSWGYNLQLQPPHLFCNTVGQYLFMLVWGCNYNNYNYNTLLSIYCFSNEKVRSSMVNYINETQSFLWTI